MTPLEYENNLYTEMYAFLKTESDNILDDAHSKTFSFFLKSAKKVVDFFLYYCILVI